MRSTGRGELVGRAQRIDDTGARQAQLRGAIEALLPEVVERAELLGTIRTALQGGDDASALVLMRRYCGLTPDLKVTP